MVLRPEVSDLSSFERGVFCSRLPPGGHSSPCAKLEAFGLRGCQRNPPGDSMARRRLSEPLGCVSVPLTAASSGR